MNICHFSGTETSACSVRGHLLSALEVMRRPGTFLVGRLYAVTAAGDIFRPHGSLGIESQNIDCLIDALLRESIKSLRNSAVPGMPV
jgi:hypothetical protein